MSNDIFLIGGVGSEITLEKTIEKIDALDNDDAVMVNIHSKGGDVFEGLAIYNYLKGLDRVVHTASAGIVASIASVFFLAGEKRFINDGDTFVIHLPSGGNFGNAEDLEKTADELRDIENKLAKIYAKETDLTKIQALKLMKEDNILESKFLKDNGFVDKIIKFKAVATYNFNKNKMDKKQVTQEVVESLFKKYFNKAFKKSEPQGKIVQDANGVEIDFFKLKPDQEIEIGAEAMIDDKKAVGEYTMPNGNKWIFVDGKFDKKIVQETDLEKANRENSELKDELQTMTEDIEAQKDLVKEAKKNFLDFKNTLTSEFDFDGKVVPTEPQEPKNRTVYK